MADVETAFMRALIEAARSQKSWRQRLQWVRDRLIDPSFPAAPGHLATIAVYLRLLATGELRCEEDGRHFRPNHHAEAALQIESALERLTTPQTAWILRRIYPYLPSWGEEFRRSEPLTHVRDIAHRNDIPPDLKKEIKHRLQNKLHRCAGPEDLRTSAEILGRITAPGAGYAPAFVQEFQAFHEELKEFFNATNLDQRLQTIRESSDKATAEAVRNFQALKAAKQSSVNHLLALLEQLVAVRRQLAGQMERLGPHQRSQLRLADVGLEDYAFALLSELSNHLDNLTQPDAWRTLLCALEATLENLRLNKIEPEECGALLSECSAWARDFAQENRFHLLRVLATLGRARRLAETYTDRINHLFPPRVEELGRALGIADHALKLFSEGDVRGHVVFQLSRLVDLGLQAVRQILQLPPWEAIVPGEASGLLVRAAELTEFESKPGPFLVLLDKADGEAEIPSSIKGIVLGHPMPHLSHLGVRARQARVPFAASADSKRLNDFATLLDKQVCLRVGPDGIQIEQTHANVDWRAGGASPLFLVSAPPTLTVPDVVIAEGPHVLALDQARSETCGPKAAGAQRLLELAGRSGGLFRAPRGLTIPFGVMERCLEANPEVRKEYLALQEMVGNEREPLLQRLRELIRALKVPDEICKAVLDFFGSAVPLAVRSSANGEDLEHLAGAGLYESVMNVSAAAVAPAITQVWASLWTRRATLSRMQAGIPHSRLHVAVLLQELVVPDLSFIMHTVDPLTGNRDVAMVELAVGLGEVLASSSIPGTPYRIVCQRKTGAVKLVSCANFSIAMRPASGTTSLSEERLDYSRVPLSADPGVDERLGQRLGQVANFLEGALGQPQDVEGVCVGDRIYLVQTRPQQGL